MVQRIAGGVLAVLGSGLMRANMLRAFHCGKARTSHDGPSSRIREPRVASARSCPACHLTNASASAVMKRSIVQTGIGLADLGLAVFEQQPVTLVRPELRPAV